MSTTMLSISKCCCQFRLSCSLFWFQTHVGASSYFFFHTKENGSARHLAAIIVEHPLPCSGRIPCQALLTPARVYWFPRVAPARAICLFETPASKGTSKLCQGFRVRLNLKYYLCPATTQFPAQVRKCYEKKFCSLQKICFRTGCWGCDCYPSDCPRFLTTSSCQCLGVYCCVGPVVQGAFATVWLLPSDGWAGVFLCPWT